MSSVILLPSTELTQLLQEIGHLKNIIEPMTNEIKALKERNERMFSEISRHNALERLNECFSRIDQEEVYSDDDDIEYYYDGLDYNIESISSIKTSQIRDFSNMFTRYPITDLSELSNWDVSNGTNFRYMFAGCKYLESLFMISNWNVSNGIDFKGMFIYCYSFKTWLI